jgi:hypothetical protein
MDDDESCRPRYMCAEDRDGQDLAAEDLAYLAAEVGRSLGLRDRVSQVAV